MSGAPFPLDAPNRRTAQDAARSLRGDATRLGRRLAEEIDAQPLHAVVAALVVGFALGGGIPRGAITLLLGVGARAAGSRLGESILENAPRFGTAPENS
jgi:hypothetical protein